MANRSVLHAASRQKRRGRKPSARERVDDFVHTHPVGVAAATFLLGGAIGATIGAMIGASNDAREERRRQQEHSKRAEKTPIAQQYSSFRGSSGNTVKPLHKAPNAQTLYTQS